MDEMILERLKEILEEQGPDVTEATAIAVVKELVRIAFKNLSERKKKKRR